MVLDALIGAAVWTAMTTTVSALLTQFSSGSKPVSISSLVAKHHIATSSALVFAAVSSGLALNLIGFDAHLLRQDEDTIDAMRVLLSMGSLVISLLAIYVVSLFGKQYSALKYDQQAQIS